MLSTLAGDRSALSAADTVDLLDAAERAEAARIAMIERVVPAVVCIFDEHQRGGGSGVIIDEAGYGLTNYHVVAGMLESRRGLGGLSDGALYDLQVLGIDPGGDVAMFKLSGKERFACVPLADSDRVRVGDEVIALGNPFMLADDYTPTVTLGIVSGVHRYQWGSGDTLLYSDCIQIDAPINPGNSGGPLFNERGEVIGINGRISVALRRRVNVGLGYAITADQIKPFLPALRASLAAEHGTMQAVVRDRPDGSVVFVELLEDGPAWKLGIRPGDTLLRFEGRPIRSANEYASILGTLPARWPVAVSFRKREGTVLHRIARTEPIKIKETEAFEPDPHANAIAVETLVRRFQATVSEEPPDWAGFEALFKRSGREKKGAAVSGQTGAGDTAWRITFDGEEEMPERPSPGAWDLFCRCLAPVTRTLVPARETKDLVRFQHAGADRFMRLDRDGNIVESSLLECLRLSLDKSVSAFYQFEAGIGRLRRIIATDRPTGATVEVVLDDTEPWGSSLSVKYPSGGFRLVRKNAATPRRPTTAAERRAPPSARALDDVVDHLSRRVVKLVGAKVGRSPGFGSGICVSSDGLVLTVDSALLDSSNIRAYLPDGSRRGVVVVAADRQKQLALLRLARAPDAGDAVHPASPPFFELGAGATLVPGQWVLAGGNPFKVASGVERVSVSRGVYSGTVKLDATRGTQGFPYRGDVLVIDAITSTPGFPGGALVDLDGRLVGMIGRVVESRATHTMLNYAIPAGVLSDFVAAARAPGGRPVQAQTPPPERRQPPYHGIKFFELGYRSNPVYVERVKRGSPAARAGVRKDDLIVGANGRPVPKLEALRRIIRDCQPGDALELTLMRDNEVRKVSIILEESHEPRR